MNEDMKEFLEEVLNDHQNLVVHGDLDAVEELHDALEGGECPIRESFTCLDFEMTVGFYDKIPFIEGEDVIGCEYCANFHDPNPNSYRRVTWKCLKKHVNSNEWNGIKHVFEELNQ